MGIVFRQSAKNSIVLVIGNLLGALIIWLSTKYFSKQQVGFFRNFTQYAVSASQILILGLGSTMAVYIHTFAKDNRKRRMLFTLCFMLPILFTIISSIFYFIFRDLILQQFKVNDRIFMQHFYEWLPLYALFFLCQSIFEVYLSTHMRIAVTSFLREVALRLISITSILLFTYGIISFNSFIIINILSYLGLLLAFIALSVRIKSFGFYLKLGEFSRDEYINMFHFSWFHFLLTISIVLIGVMDLLLIPFYDKNGFTSIAIYSVAIFILSFIQLPSKALMPSTFTSLAKAFAENDIEDVKDIFKRASLNILIASIAMALVICCNIQNIISIINNGYEEVIPLFLILFIGRFIDMATGMNDQILSIAKYYRFNFYLSVLVIILLFFMIKYLTRTYGLFGAAWSTTIVYVLFNIVKYFYVWFRIGVQPFSNRTLLVIMAALPALAAGYFLPHFFTGIHHLYIGTLIDAGIRSILIVIVYMLMLLWLKPSPDLEEYIATIKKNKRLF